MWCIQVQTDVSVSSKHQTLQGVAFPLHRDAVEALQRYKDKTINYVQLVSPPRVAWNLFQLGSTAVVPSAVVQRRPGIDTTRLSI